MFLCQFCGESLDLETVKHHVCEPKPEGCNVCGASRRMKWQFFHKDILVEDYICPACYRFYDQLFCQYKYV